MTVNINKRIYDCRFFLGLSQEYVADYLCMSVAVYDRLEKGVNEPTPEQFQKLSKIFGVKESYLKQSTDLFSKPILARNGQEISEYDQKQLRELVAYQLEISRS
ncbi:MAG: Helix-turn-helix domain [Bacillus sp. (in: firmicutes)]|nr:Helix-turn-helix domain [Bacillus sp. (in: firmicutes)]